MHFLHVRFPEPDALPVIMTHGWPGSVVEFLDVIGPLTAPRSHGADPTSALHLVLPHLRGYGCPDPPMTSAGPSRASLTAWAELMHRLGYVHYGAQGGDWGHAVTLELGVADPDHVVGVHVNTLLTLPPADAHDAVALDAADRSRLQRLVDVQADMSGYAHLQATRPQTLAYGLTDSPVGQLAWIVEKFHDWVDPRNSISSDRLLTNVMLYWLTATAGSSARLYAEPFQPSTPPAGRRVPTGVALFAGDLATPVRRLAERSHNITRWTELEPGGHFAALEQPDLFAADVRAFFHHLC